METPQLSGYAQSNQLVDQTVAMGKNPSAIAADSSFNLAKPAMAVLGATGGNPNSFYMGLGAATGGLIANAVKAIEEGNAPNSAAALAYQAKGLVGGAMLGANTSELMQGVDNEGGLVRTGMHAASSVAGARLLGAEGSGSFAKDAAIAATSAIAADGVETVMDDAGQGRLGRVLGNTAGLSALGHGIDGIDGAVKFGELAVIEGATHAVRDRYNERGAKGFFTSKDKFEAQQAEAQQAAQAQVGDDVGLEK